MKPILLLSILCFGQDPDLSTPKKACDAFAKSWLSSRQIMKDAIWTQIIPNVEKQGDFLFSEQEKRKLQQRRKSYLERAQRSMVQNRTIELGSAKKNEDGSVSIKVSETYERGPAGAKTQKEHRNHLFTFVKIGEEWKVRDLYEPCRFCASGPCGSCATCNTRGVVRISPGKERGPSMDPIAPKERSFSTDLSTPEATARSYVDWKLHQGSLLSGALLKAKKENIETLEPYLHPDVLVAMKSLNDAQTRQAKESFPKNEKRFHIGPVKMEGEKAYVIVELRRDENGRGRQKQNRIVMTTEKETWLISAVQNGCRSCKNTGACPSCAKSDPCYACDGTKKCNKCEGKGWD